MDKNRPLTFEHTMHYQADADEYTLWMVRRKRHPWRWLWLLLLLLPLLLLIKCQKEVVVTCVDADSGAPIPGAEVSVAYTSHYVWKDGHFFPSELVERVGVTDEEGRVTFKDLPCSVYSYLFYAFSKAEYSAENACHAATSLKQNFHYRKKVTIKMPPLRDDLRVLVKDIESKGVIPGARVRYRFIERGDVQVDSVDTDAAGIAVIPGMRVCSTVDLEASCYGYADTSRTRVPCSDLLLPDDSTALWLTPVKEPVHFLVKNVVSKQPIPAAECHVTLTWPDGNYADRRTVLTSIDGQGTAFCDSAFVRATIQILAHKVHYRDSTLAPDPQGRPWTVDRFIVQDEDTRTVWLAPEPYLLEFVNLDSLDRRIRIPGAKNRIRVTHPDGKTEEYEEISNSNGIFPVTAYEDDKVEIYSEAEPGYKSKRTTIPRFGDVEDEEKDREILMEPYMETLVFRTIDADTGSLLPNCSLDVDGSVSGRLAPFDSGNGEFRVTFRRTEHLTIRATKPAYKPTTDKVNNKTWDYLKVSQDRRDIPLKLALPPCGDYPVVPNGSQPYHEQSYYMGRESGIATIWLDFDSATDYLTIYDSDHAEPGKEITGFNNRGLTYEHTFQFQFGLYTPRTGIITVVINNNSHWQYKIYCP